MWLIVVTSVGLLLVLEGILPFLSPHFWREMMLNMCRQSDRLVRIVGLISMLLGLALVCVAHDLL